MSDTDPLERLLDSVVDTTPVLTRETVLDSPLQLQRFIDDVAQKIQPIESIARRYGFAPPESVIPFIRDNPEIRRRIKQRRAIWESDASIDLRLRAYAGHALLESMPETAGIMLDKNHPPATRLDATKLYSRMAGVDGLPPAPKEGSIAAAGGQFSVNITFSSGKIERVTAVEAPPTIEGEAA